MATSMSVTIGDEAECVDANMHPWNGDEAVVSHEMQVQRGCLFTQQRVLLVRLATNSPAKCHHWSMAARTSRASDMRSSSVPLCISYILIHNLARMYSPDPASSLSPPP